MKHWLVGIVTVTGILGVFLLEPIPQDPAFHAFADQRTLLGIPHGGNVVSSLAFLLVGILGISAALRKTGPGFDTPAYSAWLAFFSGIALTGFGSAWYHLAPDNPTLVFDRLPMSIAFMALFAAIIGEHINARLGRLSLVPLLVIGCGSVLYWYWTERHGAGDLRLYALVQFLPVVLIPIILLAYRSRFTRGTDIFVVLGIYAVSKLAEHFDAAVYSLGSIISGHTAKHLLAAGAAYWVLRMLKLRNRDKVTA